MKLFVFFLFALTFYILADNILIPVPADRVDVISICPELTTPQFLFHSRHPLKYLPCRYALDCPYNLCRTICRNRLH